MGFDGRFTVEGGSDAEGAYGVIYDAVGGVHFIPVVRGDVLEMTAYETDERGEPIEEGAIQMRFDRVRSGG